MTDSPPSDQHSGSTERFGYSWSNYNTILPDHEEQFRKWTSLLEQSWWKGKTFVDVGCGIGRNSYWPSTYGASGVAVDLDPDTLDVARRNLADVDVDVQQGSAYELEGLEGFDVVFSLGVIHHLERPLDALRAMFRATKPGGKVLIWVYGYEGNEWIVNGFDPVRKVVFSKLPIGMTHILSVPPTLALWAALRAGFTRNDYMRSLRKYSFDQLRVIVFDQMLPRVANYWRHDEVIQLLEAAGLENVEIEQVNEMSWCAMGTRPE
ncbi:MAG: SAM-dependent methyltransferase [Bradymonadia bacterium]|jgi:SAM-dependent methyltransferase